ncbi:MAG: chemotaxis protein CheW [Pseudomonadota bacterium]
MAKRIDLREYQENLLARFREQAGQDVPAVRLGMLAGGRRWLIDLHEAGEVAPLMALSPVPGARPWLRGIASVRSEVCAVNDLAALAGAAPTPLAGASLLLVNARVIERTALLVERTLGLRKLADFSAAGRPSAAPAWIIAEYRDGVGATWQEISLTALMREPGFIHAVA